MSVATITSPIWLVKTRMQLQTKLQDNANEYNYKNSFDCAKRVYQEEGFRGFYKGLGASYLGTLLLMIIIVILLLLSLFLFIIKLFNYNRLNEVIHLKN